MSKKSEAEKFGKAVVIFAMCSLALIALLAVQGFFSDEKEPTSSTVESSTGASPLPPRPFDYSVTNIEDTSSGTGQTWRVSVDCFSDAPPTRQELEQAASRIYSKWGGRGRWLSSAVASHSPSVWIEFSLGERPSDIPYAVAQIHADARDNDIIINR